MCTTGLAPLSCSHAFRSRCDKKTLSRSTMGRTKQVAVKSVPTSGRAPSQKMKPAGSKKPACAPSAVRKPRRLKPGTKALREIRKAQKSTDLLMRKLPFQRRVRKVAAEMRAQGEGDIRFQNKAMATLQESAEAFLVELLTSTNAQAIHAQRVTVQKRDIVSAAPSLRVT